MPLACGDGWSSYAWDALVLLPGVFTLQTIPGPVAVSTVAPITLEAKILHALPQSGTHGLSSDASLCNHPAHSKRRGMDCRNGAQSGSTQIVSDVSTI